MMILDVWLCTRDIMIVEISMWNLILALLLLTRCVGDDEHEGDFYDALLVILVGLWCNKSR